MLPKVLASSVIRSSNMGDAHGGLYLVDLETEKIDKVIDWDNQKIDWEGRGGERGLRGIDFYENQVFIASSNEIYIYDKNLELVEILSNKYLRHNHEICIYNNKLFITSTGFDTILIYDLSLKKFIKSFCIRASSGIMPETSFLGRRKRKLRNYLGLPQRIQLNFFEFDPLTNNGPKKGDTIHLNNVFIFNDSLYFSGTILENLYSIENGEIRKHIKLHFGTHNVKKYKNGYLLNNTYYKPRQISYLDENGSLLKSFKIISYNSKDILNSELPDNHAVQSFGRGLCVYNDLIIGGSSPATISVYDFKLEKVIKTVRLSKDIRNAIHGLEVWPY